MTANRIKEAALNHFAEQGYEGASLANIAEDVGIKKPSIYAHFKGKDDLFLQVIEEVFQHEFMFLTTFFDSNEEEALSNRLYHLLVHYRERYEHNETVKFWMRTMFFPPTHVYEQVMSHVYAYLDKLEDLLTSMIDLSIKNEEISPMDANSAAVAFMCLLDGVLVELLYGGSERFEKRLHAAWYVYWRGITNNS